MQRGQRSFFFPPYVIFLSLLAENSQCDNRGTLSSSSRPCSCKVCMQYGGLQSEILGLCSNHLLLNLLFISRFVSASVFFFLLSPFMREMSLKGRWITYVHVCACVCVCVCVHARVCVCVCCRTTWQAPCATSVSPVSSTYRRPTPRAVCVASAWASPGSVPALLGPGSR